MAHYRGSPHLRSCRLHLNGAVFCLLVLAGCYTEAQDQVSSHQAWERLSNWKYSLPQDLLATGIANTGHPARLRRVLLKLLAGEPITAVFAGGSVTCGVGAWTPKTAYVERWKAWLEQMFPHPDHNVINACVPGATTAYYIECMDDMVSANADLVFLEFTANDGNYTELHGKERHWVTGVLNHPRRRSYELLLRKLLLREQQPAVVVLHWWRNPDRLRKAVAHNPFWETAQTEIDVIVQYYAVTSLSWRNTIHAVFASNLTGFSVQEVYQDSVHPRELGHRVFSEILISALHQALLAAAWEPDRATGGGMPVPPSLFPNNEPSRGVCYKALNFKALVVPDQGWSWVDESTNDVTHKLGFVSTTPGSVLTVQVDTDLDSEREVVAVAIGILLSYENMGIALLECVEGCTCVPQEISALHREKISIEAWYYADVTKSPACKMRITNTDKTKSGGHKFKLTSLLVSEHGAVNLKGQPVKGIERFWDARAW